jgi:histone acetyltransferase (RNA polymerase elongator complex component)
MSKKEGFFIIPVFIPHKGCPFDCIYCNQKNISGQKDEMTIEKMKEIVELYLSTNKLSVHTEIAFYGGSFTGIPKAEQLEFLEIADGYFKAGKIDGIRLSTRPDYINSEILSYLKECNVTTIELGVQSMDDEVLMKSCRGHKSSDSAAASMLIRDNKFILGIQTMIGLPGSNREKEVATAKSVVKLSPDFVRIYPTLVIKDTYLEKMYQEGSYIPLTLEEAVDTCAQLVDIYEESGIKVIRIGLQATDNISEGHDVVSGPFHPALRQLVESRRILREMESCISQKDFENSYSVTIASNSRNISTVMGQKKGNINRIIGKYGFKKVNIIVDDSLKEIFKIYL